MAEEKKGLIGEFKEFIAQGNVMDMAVGIIIGTAFTAIVNSLVEDIIMPIVAIATPGGLEGLTAQIGEATLTYGHFLMAVIDFLIIAFVVFMMVKGMNGVRARAGKVEEAAEPRTCPYCKSEIADDATRCPHCTSEL